MFENLSQREIEVLKLVAEGNSNKEISSQLNISPNTTKQHLQSLRDKLDARNRTQAVVLALKQGLITLNEIK